MRYVESFTLLLLAGMCFFLGAFGLTMAHETHLPAWTGGVLVAAAFGVGIILADCAIGSLFRTERCP